MSDGYYYKRNTGEPYFTVGFGSGSDWHPAMDTNDEEEARREVITLNGGVDPAELASLRAEKAQTSSLCADAETKIGELLRENERLNSHLAARDSFLREKNEAREALNIKIDELCQACGDAPGEYNGGDIIRLKEHIKRLTRERDDPDEKLLTQIEQLKEHAEKLEDECSELREEREDIARSLFFQCADDADDLAREVSETMRRAEDAEEPDMFWNPDDPEESCPSKCVKEAAQYFSSDWDKRDFPGVIELLCAKKLPNAFCRLELQEDGSARVTRIDEDEARKAQEERGE